MKVFKAIIVDDDFSARSILKKYLEIDDKVLVVASADSAAAGMDAMERLAPDVIFLDINMPHEDGIEFARKLRELENEIPIVFTTAYANYASLAFDIKPIDYLVKPFGLNEIFDVLTKIENYFDEKLKLEIASTVQSNALPDKLRFKTASGYIFINRNQIVYIKVCSRGTELILSNGKTEFSTSILSTLANQLKFQNFLKIGRSTIINLDYVEKVDRKLSFCELKYNNHKIGFKIPKQLSPYLENLKSLRI